MMLLPTSSPKTCGSDREEYLKRSTAKGSAPSEHQNAAHSISKYPLMSTELGCSPALEGQVTFYPISIQPSQPFILHITPSLVTADLLC